MRSQRLQPGLASAGLSAWGFGWSSGDPHLLHLSAVAGFSEPHAGHLRGGAGSLRRPPSTWPLARFAPPSRSPPHCLHILAVAAFRAPQ